MKYNENIGVSHNKWTTYIQKNYHDCTNDWLPSKQAVDMKMTEWTATAERYILSAWSYYRKQTTPMPGVSQNLSSNSLIYTLHWRHNDHDGVSNHQPHGCLLNRLFRRRSKKTSKFRVTGLCVGDSPGPVNSPHKGPVTRKMFPFDDGIMYLVFAPLPFHTKWHVR